ncbi:SESN1 protein, partial [Polypterus senegalus]
MRHSTSSRKAVDNSSVTVSGLFKMCAHCERLCKKQLLKAEDHSWSLAELIHAVVLLTHYHSLAFTFGCGINPEIHCEGGHTFRPPSVGNYCVCDLANGNSSLDEMQINQLKKKKSAPTRDVSRHFEDPSYGYKDFSSVGNMFLLSALRYDDYDYGEINQLLDRSFKVYIKTMVCSPEKTTKRMYDSFWRQFEHSEKVSIFLEYCFKKAFKTCGSIRKSEMP